MRRTLLVLPIIAVLTLSGCAPSAPTSAGPTGSPATTTATSMLTSINARRASAGVGPLTLCASLGTAAQRHSQDQASMNRMSHTGSNGSTMVDRVQDAGYTGWTSLAENVAYGYSTVESVMAGWMASPGHRANLLAASTTHVGMGHAVSASGTHYWTQDFGRSGRC